MGNIPPSVIRQPPRPRRIPAADIREEESKAEVPPLKVLVLPDDQIDGGKSTRATRTYYLRRCKRKSPTSIESLPAELLFEILSRVPGQDIYEARLVCRKWYRTIHNRDFINAQLGHATYGLLLRTQKHETDSFLIHARGGRAEISKFRCQRRCLVLTSCNGLMLEFEKKNLDNIYVSNPATGQIFVLPPYVRGVNSLRLWGIAYASVSMEYKVVLPIRTGQFSKERCYILTVGVDKSWRSVDLRHLSSEATRAFWSTPVITEGFIHWFCVRSNMGLTLNVETEIFTETPGLRPSQHIHEDQTNIYLSTGKYLSLLRPCGEFSWQVWEMRPENGEWIKMGSFCLESQRRRFKQLGLILPTEANTRLLSFRRRTHVVPVGWVKYMEVLALSSADVSRRTIFIFNLVTGEFDEMELPSFRLDYKIMMHKSSLVWLCG
ncbi:Unknown protein [Striga hermonthica]|uniref:F-box domain-containing protein n=1 Tax=Striga hermonthica TaxID=68872 RepID=A0A9N7NF12_STRHE|nr:Unknown protein [Striga hermonthica]